MHVALFDGLYANLVAYLAERGLKRANIEVRTDQVDSPIVKDFRVVAARLLNDDPVAGKVTAFDVVEKKVLDIAPYTIEAILPPDGQIELTVQSLTINPIKKVDGLVLAADVPANSLHHMFKHRSDDECYQPLNRPAAIVGHPLAHNLCAFRDWGVDDIVGDRLYAHPKARNK